MDANITPEQWFEEDINIQRETLKQDYYRSAKELQRQARLIRMNPREFQSRIGQLALNARRNVADLDLESKMKQRQFQRIDMLSQVSGANLDPTEVKWKILLGAEAGNALFPRPKKPTDVIKQFGELDTVANKIESNLRKFRIQPAAEKPSWLRASRAHSKWIGLSPALTAAYSLWPKEEVLPETLEVFDTTMIGYDEKGRQKQGDWREATPEEIQDYELNTNLLKQIKMKQQAALVPSAAILNTAIQSRRINPQGSIADQAKVLLQRRQAPQPQEVKQLDADTARVILQEAGGDKDRARELARSRGYSF